MLFHFGTQGRHWAVFTALLAFGGLAQAAGNNFYVCGSAATCNSGSSGWSSGSDSNNCTSKATPCATTAGVLGKLGSGDIANYGNGSYSLPTCSLVYGSPTNGYTTIKAEQSGGVTMDGAINCQYASPAGHSAYWIYDGIFLGSNSILVSGMDHIKFLRVGAYDPGSALSATMAAGDQSSYILFEECYAYGNGRYKFLAWQGSNIVMRKNVARMDATYAVDQQLADFAMYSVTNGLMANNIAIDSDQSAYWSGDERGCIYLPNTKGDTLNIVVDSNVCLHSRLGGIAIDGHEGAYISTAIVRNNTTWDAWGATGKLGTNYSRGLADQWLGNTFGRDHGTALADLNNYSGDSNTAYNNVFYDLTLPATAAWDYMTHDYNVWYQYSSGLPSLASHERTNINPIWNASTNPTGALKYITRIEPGSNLAGIGQGGANIGATLQYMIGVPGTLYGETGYNTVQSTPMWPFPNEAVAKAKMAAYTGPPAGARGFAAAGNGLYGGPITLTSYIWETLGNACPADICTYGQSNPTINSVSCTQTSYTQAPGGIQCTASVTGGVTSWAWSLQTPDANCSFSAQVQSPTLTCSFGGLRKPCVTVQPGGASACSAGSYGWRLAKPSSLQVN